MDGQMHKFSEHNRNICPQATPGNPRIICQFLKASAVESLAESTGSLLLLLVSSSGFCLQQSHHIEPYLWSPSYSPQR